MLFRAKISFFGNFLGERSSSITFEADDKAAAIVDAKRWFDNRHTNLPDYFGMLFWMRIYVLMPQRVQEDGYLPPDTGMFGYEWKCDWGKPYGK